jgi:hypothetical protein
MNNGLYRVGDLVKRNDALVIAVRKDVVLCYWPEVIGGEYHDRWVTWKYDAGGNTFWGHYFYNSTETGRGGLAKAAQDFEER